MFLKKWGRKDNKEGEFDQSTLFAQGIGGSRLSGGSDQKDLSLKPAQTNSSQDPISKNPSQKRIGGVAENVGPEFKPYYCQKKKKKSALFACMEISQ
jgi:hypothetical protein